MHVHLLLKFLCQRNGIQTWFLEEEHAFVPWENDELNIPKNTPEYEFDAEPYSGVLQI